MVIANVRAETVERFVNSASGFVRSKTITGVASPSDIVLAVNERNYDVDHNGSITARDALVIINAMARQSRGEGESASSSRSMKIDVNGDGKISALDALNIINYLARQNRTKRLAGEQSAVPVDEQLTRRDVAVDAVMADGGRLF